MNKKLVAAFGWTAVAAAMQARAADSTEPAQLEEVKVTGTRIQHVGMTTPTPVTSVSLDELTNLAPTTIINALVELPQFYGSATTANFNTGANGFFTSPGGGSLPARDSGRSGHRSHARPNRQRYRSGRQALPDRLRIRDGATVGSQ